MTLIATNLDSPGLYCLDEPEAASSFNSILVLVGALHDLAAAGSQVLCATHSPVLAALPGATILEVGEWGLRPSSWDDLVLVQNWRPIWTIPADISATSSTLTELFGFGSVSHSTKLTQPALMR